MREPVIVSIPGEGVPFARAGAQGKRRFTPAKQAKFMADVRRIAGAAMRGQEPLAGPLRMDARFTYLRPASHTRKDRACDWKATKPDLDNLSKLIADSFNTIVWADDAQVADLTIQKKYGPVASVVVTVSEIED